jgi:hypothetical protein
MLNPAKTDTMATMFRPNGVRFKMKPIKTTRTILITTLRTTRSTLLTVGEVSIRRALTGKIVRIRPYPGIQRTNTMPNKLRTKLQGYRVSLMKKATTTVIIEINIAKRYQRPGLLETYFVKLVLGSKGLESIS